MDIKRMPLKQCKCSWDRMLERTRWPREREVCVTVEGERWKPSVFRRKLIVTRDAFSHFCSWSRSRKISRPFQRLGWGPKLPQCTTTSVRKLNSVARPCCIAPRRCWVSTGDCCRCIGHRSVLHPCPFWLSNFVSYSFGAACDCEARILDFWLEV